MNKIDYANLEFINSRFECDDEGRIFLVAYYKKK